jgi:predicted nucleotidyltransferase
VETTERQILDAIDEIPGISSLLVFGSRARGNARPDSDLDVAVQPDDGQQDDHARLKLRSRVASALADLAPGGRVDVVLLDRAPDLLRQRVMEHGRMILCRDEGAWRDLRVRTMREYGDREWARDLLRRGLRRSLLEGRTDGRSARTFESLERAFRISR